MFDYQSELVISRMERERQIKALALAAAARPGRRSGLRAGPSAGSEQAWRPGSPAWPWPSTGTPLWALSPNRRRIRRAAGPSGRR